MKKLIFLLLLFISVKSIAQPPYLVNGGKLVSGNPDSALVPGNQVIISSDTTKKFGFAKVNGKLKYADSGYFKDVSSGGVSNDTANVTKLINGASLRLRSWAKNLVAVYNAKKAGTKSAKAVFGIWGDSIAADETYDLVDNSFRALGYGGFDGVYEQRGYAVYFQNGATPIGQNVFVTQITNNGSGVATATSNNHGLSNGTIVNITGASNAAYNITNVAISGVTTNTFNFAISGTPASPDPSGQVYFNVTPNFNKWVTGSYVNMPNGSSLAICKNSQPDFSDTIKYVKVYYILENGAGSFKMQQSVDGGSYSDISGYTSISAATSGSDSLGVLKVPITVNMINPFVGYARALVTSGTVKIIGFGVENDRGFKYSSITCSGGIEIKNMMLTPEPIIGTYLRDLAPDFLTMTYKDDTTNATVNALQKYQKLVYKYAPQAAVIYSTAYDSQSGSSEPQNNKMRQWFDTTTVTGEKYLFDAYNYVGEWTQAAYKGLYDLTQEDNIISATYNSGTGKVTINVASTSGAYVGAFLAIRNSLTADYNGIYRIDNIVSSIQMTLTPISSQIISNSTLSGGLYAVVDGVHIYQNGRYFLSNLFNRDFNVLTLDKMDYPYEQSEPSYLSLKGGTVNGKVVIDDSLIAKAIRVGNAVSKMVIGEYSWVPGNTAIWLGNETPSNTNFSIVGDINNTTLNAKTNVIQSINSNPITTVSSTGFNVNGVINATTVNTQNINTTGQIKSNGPNGGKNSGFIVDGQNPFYAFNNTDAIADNRLWDMGAGSSGQFELRILNDASNAGTPFLRGFRNGLTPTLLEFFEKITTTSDIEATGYTKANSITGSNTTGVQILAQNNSSSSSAAAEYFFEVNGNRMGKIMGSNAGYTLPSASGGVFVTSFNNSRVGLVANVNGGGTNGDVILSTSGAKSTPDLLAKGITGNILIGSEADVLSSRFTVTSTTQGSMPFSRMTRPQWNAISKAANLMGYDSILAKVLLYDGATTKVLLDSAAADSKYIQASGTSSQLVVGDGSKISVGSNGQVLTVSGGLPVWQTPASITSLDTTIEAYTGLTNYATTDTYQNVVSITLPAGNWDVCFSGTLAPNTATLNAGSNAFFALSATTASASGAAIGKDLLAVSQFGLGVNSVQSVSSAVLTLTPSSTTTYYLNSQASYTSGIPQFSGYLRARRVK